MVFSVCIVYFVVFFSVHKLVCPDSTLEYSRSTSLLTVIHPASARDIADCSHSLESFIKNIRSPNVISEYIFMVTAKVIQRADFCKTHYPLVNGKSSTFFRVKCIDERVVLNMTDGSYRLPFKARNDIHGVGYRIQMALKLFAAEHITTDFYLTMDSDIRLTRPLWNSSYFLPENKAYINWQRRSVHPNYFSVSEAVMKAKGCLDPRLESWVVGVTPEVLHRNVSIFALKRLRGLYQDEILSVLFSGPLWTEYAVYHIAGCLMGNYFEYHSVAEPAVFFRWALWSRQAILKANATMDGFLAANGIPIFLQLQDNSGFTAEETEAFYIKFERKIAAAMMNENIGF